MSKPYELTALYPVVGVEQPLETAAAFTRLFGLETVFESDWYVHLKEPLSGFQVGVVGRGHESVPPGARHPVGGTALFVTIDASDVAAVWNDLKAQLDVVVPLTDEAWGQRHFTCRLPGDVMVDVVQLLPTGP